MDARLTVRDSSLERVMNFSAVADVVKGMITHKPYPSDVTDAEWQFVVPHHCLLPEDAGQRVHNLRDVFDSARWLVRSGAPWRYLPTDSPVAEVLEAPGASDEDLDEFLRLYDGAADDPPTDRRPLPESDRA